MQTNPKHTYLFYSAIAVSLLFAAVWPTQDRANSSKSALEVPDRSQVLMFGAEHTPAEPAGDITSSFIAPAPPLRNSVLQRLREMRVRFRQLDPRVQVAVTPEPASVRALGNTLSKMLASSYLATSNTATEYTALPTQQTAAVTLTGNLGDRPLIFQLVRALSPYLSGAVLVKYDDTARAGTLQLRITEAPAFYPNGAVQLPPLAVNVTEQTGYNTLTPEGDT